jgi:hypothetical protein
MHSTLIFVRLKLICRCGLEDIRSLMEEDRSSVRALDLTRGWGLLFFVLVFQQHHQLPRTDTILVMIALRDATGR